MDVKAALVEIHELINNSPEQSYEIDTDMAIEHDALLTEIFRITDNILKELENG